MKIADYVKSLQLQANESHRGQCPVCSRTNTFTASNVNGTLLWNCYSASCDLGGGGILPQFITDVAQKPRPAPFEKPPSWSRRDLPDVAKQYLIKVHNNDRWTDFYWDVLKRRLVYPIYDADHKLVDGVGRAMAQRRSICDDLSKPAGKHSWRQAKWYRYANYKGGFVCGTNPIHVVVEDAPSAIAISDWVTGYALLGTNLTDEHLAYLSGVSKVVVALDKDATDKGLQMVRKLNTVTQTDLLVLDHDLKAMGETEREQLIRKHTS